MIELHWLRLVVCVDINVLDKNMNTKKITETLLDTSKKISLEIKREKWVSVQVQMFGKED